MAHVVDVLDRGAAERLADAAGPADGLVVTQGVNVRKRIADYTDEDFDRVVALNLGATFRLLRAFAPRMAERGGGSIVGSTDVVTA